MVQFWSCQLPSYNLFTLHSCLSSFGRETSLVKVMGPWSIFPPLFTPSIYFPVFTFCCSHHYHYILCLILCKQQGRRDWQPLCTRWEQSYLLCVQFQVKLATSVVNGAIVHFTTYLSFLESYRSILNLSIFAKGNLLLCYIKPSTWGNQRGARSHHQAPIHSSSGYLYICEPPD